MGNTTTYTYNYDYSEKVVNEYTKEDGKTKLYSDDAAYYNWCVDPTGSWVYSGSEWRMPTEKEADELVYGCTWEWKEEGEYATGSLAGYLVTGENGNSIFLPAAGSITYKERSGDGYQVVESNNSGCYWTSERGKDQSENYAYQLWNDKSYRGKGTNSGCRFDGRSVRAVRDIQK